MAKRIFRISDLSGGINGNNPRDIKDNEVADANCINIRVKGQITPGVTMTASKYDVNGLWAYPKDEDHFSDMGVNSVMPKPGYGAYTFESEYKPPAAGIYWDGKYPTASIQAGGSGDFTKHVTHTTSLPVTRPLWTWAVQTVNATDAAHAAVSGGDDIAEIGIGSVVNAINFDSPTADPDIAYAIFSAGPIGNNTCDVQYVRPLWYKAGERYYACDGRLANTLNVNRASTGLTQYRFFPFIAASDYTVAKWTIGPAVLTLDSDSVNATAAADKVHYNTGSYTTTNDNGGVTVYLDDASNEGLWNGSYYFYVSALYDNGLETNYIQLNATALAIANKSLEVRLGTKISSSVAPLGNDRIHGIRVYWSESDIAAPDGVASDVYLLATYDFRKGVRLANQSDWMKVEFNDPVYEMDSTIELNDPAEFQLFTYEELHGYSVEDIPEYTSIDDPGAGAVRYSTAVVGNDNRAYIGNVSIAGVLYEDRIYYSEIGEYGIFPSTNYIDFPHSNSRITALLSTGDRIFVFTNDGCQILNVSQKPFVESENTEAMAKEVYNCCLIPGGVAVANERGIHLYQRNKWINVWKERNLGALSQDSVLGYSEDTEMLIARVGTAYTVDAKGGYGVFIPTLAVTKLDYCFDADHDSNLFTIRSYPLAGVLAARDMTVPSDSGDDGGRIKYITETNTACPFEFTTKRYDFGMPGNFKNLYKIQFDIENGDADVGELRFKTNKSSNNWRQLVTAQGGSTNADLGGSNPSIADGVITVFPKQAHIAEARGFLWLQLKVASNLVVDSDDEPTDGVDVNSTFTINEIRIIYRNLGEKE